MAREVYAIKENKTKINDASMLDVCDTSERNKTGGCAEAKPSINSGRPLNSC